ncbi:MAG: ABC transporter permease [Alphaproteobacteria bacterium]|nr:ABC transporter permease [Alphaproteobacteria bacterium]
MESLTLITLSVITAATPLLFAATGELVTEKSGVLNLGVEGMMIMGAVTGFGVGVITGNPFVGVLAGTAAGAAMAGLFAFLTLGLLANQVATGLALTIFGIGLSALVGKGFVGVTVNAMQRIEIPILTDIPVLGPILFGQDPLVYFSFILLGATAFVIRKTRVGLILRAVGDNHDAAHAIGYSVVLVRSLAVLFGGACCGLAGAYLSLVYTPLWAENMTAGRGWIALALVVFATWRPGRLILGAYLFGGITILQLHAQGAGWGVPSQIMSMLPYIATIVVLVVISGDKAKIRLNAPAALGKIFHPAR